MAEQKRKLPQFKRDRIAKCIEYLKKAGTMPGAKELAKKDKFTQNTSVWLSALAQMFDARP